MLLMNLNKSVNTSKRLKHSNRAILKGKKHLVEE